ncbi:MAG: large conductance mechanosensitive channel protein MscL [Actinomycetota bacterium]
MDSSRTAGLNVAREFRAFILRGNVVDLAVGVVIGAAFGTVVSSLVKNLVTPLTGVFGDLPDFSSLGVRIGNARIGYGSFINDLLAFFIVALVVFLFVVKPLNKLMTRTSLSVGALERDCPECTSRVSVDARRCPFCTSPIAMSTDTSTHGSSA